MRILNWPRAVGGGQGQGAVIVGAVGVGGEEGGDVGHGGQQQGAGRVAVLGGQGDDHVLCVPHVEGVAVRQLQHRLGVARGYMLHLTVLLLLLLAGGTQHALCRTHGCYYIMVLCSLSRG